MTDEDKVAEFFKSPDDKGMGFHWEPNKVEEKPEDLPWPEENESNE